VGGSPAGHSAVGRCLVKQLSMGVVFAHREQGIVRNHVKNHFKKYLAAK
jgi:hypothetical protein